MTINIGSPIHITHPFVKDDAPETWRPGYTLVDMEDGTFDKHANGEGFVIFTPIAIVDLPKPHLKRVLYTRGWIDPDGNVWDGPSTKTIRMTTQRSWRLFTDPKRYYVSEIIE